LKGQGESPLKVGVDFKAAVTEPLGYEKAPRQHELQKARELPTTSDVAISEQYIGTTADNRPAAKPAIKRPAIIMGILAAPPCRAQPRHEMMVPTKTAFFLPSLSARYEMEGEPRMVPPVKEETMSPVSDVVGLLIYSTKCGCAMADPLP
jgi:hypothetical protein